MSRNIVIVGAGLAGLRATERLLSGGWDGRLTLLGAEPHPPYTRPPLTKEMLQGEGGLATVELRRRPSFDRVDARWGCEVTGADLAAQEVRLSDGSIVAYDGLIVASGLSPRRLFWGPDAPDTHVIRTITDAQILRARLGPGVRVTVIGAGFVGCEAAASARALGCTVHVVDPFAAPLATQLGRIVGAQVAGWFADQDVELTMGAGVEQLTRRGGSVVLRLSTVAEVEADVVIEAVGGIPNTDWLEGNGLDLRDGVLCDADLHPLTEAGPMRSVVAVGDVARFPQPRFGASSRRIEHWTHAADSAAYGARALLAQLGDTKAPAPYAALPSFWSNLFDHRIQSVGLPAAGMADQRVLEGTAEGAWVIGYHDEGRLVGAVLLDVPDRMMHVRSLVEASTEPVGTIV